MLPHRIYPRQKSEFQLCLLILHLIHWLKSSISGRVDSTLGEEEDRVAVLRQREGINEDRSGSLLDSSSRQDFYQEYQEHEQESKETVRSIGENAVSSRQESLRSKGTLEETQRFTHRSEHLVTSQLVDELANKLKETFKNFQEHSTNETKRAIKSTVKETSVMNIEQLNIAALKFDGLMQHFKTHVDTSSQKLWNEESRLAKLQVRMRSCS